VKYEGPCWKLADLASQQAGFQVAHWKTAGLGARVRKDVARRGMVSERCICRLSIEGFWDSGFEGK